MSTLYHYVVGYTYTNENYLDKSDRTELVVEKPITTFDDWLEAELLISAAEERENVKMFSRDFLRAEEIEDTCAKPQTIFDKITESPHALAEYIANVYVVDESEREQSINDMVSLFMQEIEDTAT